ncbi:MAG: sulfide/dihydroorotate dehydrogenase-like FAD/NAD-binding protein [Deltaproteobacteria bacterium]|jgi:glutamate synthase (NADPH) small chain|nr:sulfide/dihydroorotate dehydrogenase-like FAD/NAD-binding protein [Deltaproteobacteria bacterium]
MNKILTRNQLSENVVKLTIEAPVIAKKRKAGQFIILRTHKKRSERIPLTIADADALKGTITLVFQVVGKSTAELAAFQVGDSINDLVGPLGKATHIENFGNVVCIGGGIGIAPMHPIAQALKGAGNNVTSILGARTKGLLVMEEEVNKASDKVIIVTDDGSYGEQGFVTNALEKIINDGQKVDVVVAIGPAIMMKMVCKVTEPHKIKTVVSLNTIMVDGTGMCGCCRVSVDGTTQFVCVDGPEFDGHKVDFDGMMKRQSTYVDLEKQSYDIYKSHGCGNRCTCK